MAIIALWDNAHKTIIRLEFETEWSWEQLYDVIASTDDMITSVEHTVDIIIDIEGSQIPKDFMSAAKSLLANPEPRDNEGHRVIVGASTFIRNGYGALKKTFGDKLVGREVLFAQDLRDARAILRGLRMQD